MKRFKRDMKILKPELKQVLKLLITINLLVTGFCWVMDKTPTVGTPIVTVFEMALLFYLAGNGGILIGFIVRYLTEWRTWIQEAFDEHEANEKYQFFSNRFNQR